MHTRRLSLIAVWLWLCATPARPEGGDLAPGFSPVERDGGMPHELVGRWVNSFLYAEGEEPEKRYWQVVDIRADGETVHDYFSADPSLATAIPYTRVVSFWQAGNFVDPDAEKGCIEVIRFEPMAYMNYDARRRRFRTIRGNFAPWFRSFVLSVDREELALSEAVILEVPVDRVLSFPAEAQSMLFSRFEAEEISTAVEAVSWGVIKKGMY